MNIENYNYIKPVKITKIAGNETYIDITVEDNNTFIIRCGNKNIVSHNCDGAHITGLLLGLFYKHARHLFDENRIYRLRTPIIVAMKKGKIIEHFFNIGQYREWENTNDLTNVSFKYLKGLGSIKKEEFHALIKEYGIEHFLEVFNINCDDIIDLWLNGSRAEDRKLKISEYSLDINSI